MKHRFKDQFNSKMVEGQRQSKYDRWLRNRVQNIENYLRIIRQY